MVLKANESLQSINEIFGYKKVFLVDKWKPQFHLYKFRPKNITTLTTRVPKHNLDLISFFYGCVVNEVTLLCDALF